MNSPSIVDDQNYTVEDLVADPSFVRWVQGSDPQVQVFWENWKKQHPEKSAKIQEARQLVVALYSFSASNLTEASFLEIADSKNYIQQRIRNPSDQSAKSRPARQLIPRTYLRAAVITLLIGSGLIFWWINSVPDQIIYQTGYGETKSITLPDQSVVTLNTNSSIRTAEVWKNDRPREIWLTGEAYFEVQQNPNLPFIVSVADLETRVLGTSFYISGYPSTPISITLESGTIQVSNPHGDLSILQPREQLLADSDLQLWKVEKVDLDQMGVWKEGMFAFNRITLKELIPSLERWYGVQIQLESGEAGNCWIHGPPTNKSIWDLLESFEIIRDVTYTVDSTGIIHIQGGNCP
ncbi:MAG: FecR domain-containing protein [Bacteroidota bacterium]